MMIPNSPCRTKNLQSTSVAQPQHIAQFLLVTLIITWLDIGNWLSTVAGLSISIASALLLLSICASFLLLELDVCSLPRLTLPAKPLMMLTVVISFLYNLLKPVDGNRISHLIIISCGSAALSAFVFFPRKPRFSVPLFITVSAIAGVILRASILAHLPIEFGGDMMLLVQKSLNNISQRQSPYIIYHMPWPLPLTYLPLCWLQYLPLHLAQIDFRWANAIFQLLLLFPVFWLTLPATWYAEFKATQKSTDGDRSRRLISLLRCLLNQANRQEAMTPLLLWCVFFLSPQPVFWSLSNTHSMFWFLLALLSCLTVRRHFFAASVCLGLALGESLMINVAIPFFVFSWWKQNGARRVLLLCVISGAVGISILLPFYLWSPHDFVLGVWEWHNNSSLAPREGWLSEKLWERQIGCSGIFWRTGHERWLKALQIMVIGVLSLQFQWQGARFRHLAPFLCVAYCAFMCLNTMHWTYLYWPAAIAALLAIAANVGIDDKLLQNSAKNSLM